MQRDTNYVQIERISTEELREVIDRLLAENNSILVNQIKQLIEERVGTQVKASEDTPEYYTVAQVTKMLKVTRQTLNAWDKSGVLKRVRIGGTIRYSVDDIEQLKVTE